MLAGRFRRAARRAHGAALLLGLLVGLLALPGCKRSAPPPASATPRLISLSPSATETVAALDATSWLVGVDEYSSYPTEVTKLPKVGSYLTPNLEVILGLRPTLVLVDDVHRAAADALHDAGIATLRCEIQTLADVETALRDVGAKLGRSEQAARVLAQITAAKQAARPAGAAAPVVLAIIDRQTGSLGGLVAAGPGSWLDELLTAVGATNALAASPVRYPKISLEEVLRSQPTVILDLSDASSHDDAPLLWQAVNVPATAQHRVRVRTDSFLRAPSPRVAAALAALRTALE